jgi:hypothetical protein
MPAEFEEVFTKDHFVDVLEDCHRNEMVLIQSLSDIGDLVTAWRWAIEGRGSYEWDDDAYKKEFGYCLDSVISVIDQKVKEFQAHKVCCEKYGHIHNLPREPVQLKFAVDEHYDKFKNRVVKSTTILGRM